MLSLGQTLDDRRLIRVLVAPVGNNSLFSKQFQIVSSLKEIPLYELNRPHNAKSCPFKAVDWLQGRLLFEYLRYDRSSLGPGDLDDFQSSKRICLVMGLINYPELMTSVTSLQDEIDHFLRRYQHIHCKRFFVFNYNFDESIPSSISSHETAMMTSASSKSINLMEFFHTYKPEYSPSLVIFPPEGDSESGHSRILIHCQEIMSHASVQIVLQFEKQMFLCEECIKRNILPIYNITIPLSTGLGSLLGLTNGNHSSNASIKPSVSSASLSTTSHSILSTSSSILQSLTSSSLHTTLHPAMMNNTHNNSQSLHHNQNQGYTNTDLNLVTIYDEREDLFTTSIPLSTNQATNMRGSIANGTKENGGKPYKKRPLGRIHKWMGDLSMQMCSPIDAMEHYVIAIQECRYLHDYLWLANALDGYSSAILLLYHMQYVPLEDYLGKDFKTIRLPTRTTLATTTANNNNAEEDGEDEEIFHMQHNSEEVNGGGGGDEHTNGQETNHEEDGKVLNQMESIEKLFLLIEERCVEALQIYASSMIFRLLEVECTLRLAKYLLTAPISLFPHPKYQLKQQHKILHYILRAILHIPGLNTQQQLECILEGALLCSSSPDSASSSSVVATATATAGLTSLPLPRKHALFLFMAAMIAIESGNYEVANDLFVELCSMFCAAAISSSAAAEGVKPLLLWTKLLETIYIQGICILQEHASLPAMTTLSYLLGLLQVILWKQHAASVSSIPYFGTYTPKVLGLEKSLPYLLSMPTTSSIAASSSGKKTTPLRTTNSNNSINNIPNAINTTSGKKARPASMSLTEDSLRSYANNNQSVSKGDNSNGEGNGGAAESIRVARSKTFGPASTTGTLSSTGGGQPPRVQPPLTQPANVTNSSTKPRSVTSDITDFFTPTASSYAHSVIGGSVQGNLMSSVKTTGHSMGGIAMHGSVGNVMSTSMDDSQLRYYGSAMKKVADNGNNSPKRNDGSELRSPSSSGKHMPTTGSIATNNAAPSVTTSSNVVSFVTPTKHRPSSTNSILSGGMSAQGSMHGGEDRANKGHTMSETASMVPSMMTNPLPHVNSTHEMNEKSSMQSMKSISMSEKVSQTSAGIKAIQQLLHHLHQVHIASALTTDNSDGKDMVELDDGHGTISLYHLVEVDYIKDMLSCVMKQCILPYPHDQEEGLVQMVHTLTRNIPYLSLNSFGSLNANGLSDGQYSTNKQMTLPVICHSIQPIIYPASNAYQSVIILSNTSSMMQTLREQYAKQVAGSGDQSNQSSEEGQDDNSSEKEGEIIKPLSPSNNAFYFDPFAKKRQSQQSSQTLLQQLSTLNNQWNKHELYHVVVLWENPLTIPIRIQAVVPIFVSMNEKEEVERVLDCKEETKHYTVYPQEVVVPPQCSAFATYLPIKLHIVGKKKLIGISGMINRLKQYYPIDDQGFVQGATDHNNTEATKADDEFAKEKKHFDVHLIKKSVSFIPKKYTFGITNTVLHVHHTPLFIDCYCSWDKTLSLTQQKVKALPTSMTTLTRKQVQTSSSPSTSSSSSSPKGAHNAKDLITPLTTKLSLLPGEIRQETLYYPYTIPTAAQGKKQDKRIDYRVIVMEHVTTTSSSNAAPLVSTKQYIAMEFGYLSNTSTTSNNNTVPNNNGVAGKCVIGCKVLEQTSYLAVQLTFVYPNYTSIASSHTPASSLFVQYQGEYYVSKLEIVLEMIYLDDLSWQWLGSMHTNENDMKKTLPIVSNEMLLVENDWQLMGKKVVVEVNLEYPEALGMLSLPTLLPPDALQIQATILPSCTILQQEIDVMYNIQNHTNQKIFVSPSISALQTLFPDIQNSGCEENELKEALIRFEMMSNSPSSSSCPVIAIPSDKLQHSLLVHYPIRSTKVQQQSAERALYWCFEDTSSASFVPNTIRLLANDTSVEEGSQASNKQSILRYGKLLYQSLPEAVLIPPPVVPGAIQTIATQYKDRIVNLYPYHSLIQTVLSPSFPPYQVIARLLSNHDEAALLQPLSLSSDDKKITYEVALLQILCVDILITSCCCWQEEEAAEGVEVMIKIRPDASIHASEDSNRVQLLSNDEEEPQEQEETMSQSSNQADEEEGEERDDTEGYLVTGQLQAIYHPIIIQQKEEKEEVSIQHQIELCVYLGGRYTISIYVRPINSHSWYVMQQCIVLIAQEY